MAGAQNDESKEAGMSVDPDLDDLMRSPEWIASIPPKPSTPERPPGLERPRESDIEMIARSSNMSVAEVQDVREFREEVKRRASVFDSIIGVGFDLLPAKSGFVQVLGPATPEVMAAFEDTPIRIIDGLRYTREEQRERIVAVSRYIGDNGYTGVVIGHEDNHVLVRMQATRYALTDIEALIQALESVLASASTSSKGSPPTNEVIIREVPDSPKNTNRQSGLQGRSPASETAISGRRPTSQ